MTARSSWLLLRLCRRMPGWWRSAAALLAVVLTAGAARAAPVPLVEAEEPAAQVAPLVVVPSAATATGAVGNAAGAAVRASPGQRIAAAPAAVPAPTPRLGAARGPRAP